MTKFGNLPIAKWQMILRRSTSTVYVVQEVVRRDRVTGEWIASHQLEPAREFGELRILIPRSAQVATVNGEPGRGLLLKRGPALKLIRDGLWDFSEEDYLIGVGAPEWVAAATIFAAGRCSDHLNLLNWNRKLNRYFLFSLPLPVRTS